jgi:hypothetical protein
MLFSDSTFDFNVNNNASKPSTNLEVAVYVIWAN